MDLDLNTLLYVCIVVAMLATGALALFGATQATHQGFRWWIGAQVLLVLGLLLQAVFASHAFVVPLVGMLLLQWPIVVLAGMRQLHMRKRPGVSTLFDWTLLAGGCALVVGAWVTDAGSARGVAAFTLAAFGVNLYSAVLVSRLGGFRQSFALKSFAATLCANAALQAVCGTYANIDSVGSAGLLSVQLWAYIAFVVAALGLVPIALSLTYERTVAKMRVTHRKLRHLADIDVLTRLPNRKHFHELATRTLATTEPSAATVLMFDIENLKRINDLLGPSTGDEALRQVGLALRETLRTRDVAGRLGGDEFAALLPETTVADAVKVAARITERLEDRQVAPRTVRLILNVGAVQMRAGDTIVEGLRRADLALDDARSHRHGRPVSASLEDTMPLHPPAHVEPKPV